MKLSQPDVVRIKILQNTDSQKTQNLLAIHDLMLFLSKTSGVSLFFEPPHQLFVPSPSNSSEELPLYTAAEQDIEGGGAWA